ncbi:MAG: pilus assembly protein TadG-related protein [Terriglobia bacterium]
MKRKHTPNPGRWGSDKGQITILVAIAMALFLIGFVGFAVDMTNLWFHRQMAQGAADAACQAGIMNILFPTGTQGFTAGTSFDCVGSPTATPCKYAALNGYNGSGLTANTPSNAVAVSFPPSTDPKLNGYDPAILPPKSMATVPFLQVDLTDRVKVFFSPLITGQLTQDVHAQAICGLALITIPVPMIILDPTDPCTYQLKGTGNQAKLSILGGPSQSVQVNSSNATASCVSGGPSVDLSKGGPNFTGSDFGSLGGPTSPPFGFNGGTTGNYVSPHRPISDPFALVPAPAQPPPPTVNGVHVPYHNPGTGCPDSGGCTRYSGGYYSNGIQVKGETAIFDPGLYYFDGNTGLSLDSNSIVRPSTAVGDGSGGTMFYFHSSASVSVKANSGGTTTDAFNTSLAQCPGGNPPNPGIGLPPALQGNILLGPCTGTYGQVDTNPDGSTTPARGMLFFQNRATNGAGSWGGGGDFLLAGTMYFHQCNAGGTGVGCGNPPADYNSSFSFGGNACSATYVLGEIVTDQLEMHGTGCVKMALDPYNLQRVLRASLVR